jgi:hypothetical protein
VEASLALDSLTDPLSDPNWVAKYHSDVYQKGMLAEAAGYLRDGQSEANWKKEFTELVQLLLTQGWDEHLGDAPTTAPVEEAVEVLGVSGPTGSPGRDGEQWWTGVGPPGTIPGAEPGDFYLDTSTGDVYEL